MQQHQCRLHWIPRESFSLGSPLGRKGIFVPLPLSKLLCAWCVNLDLCQGRPGISTATSPMQPEPSPSLLPQALWTLFCSKKSLVDLVLCCLALGMSELAIDCCVGCFHLFFDCIIDFLLLYCFVWDCHYAVCLLALYTRSVKTGLLFFNLFIEWPKVLVLEGDWGFPSIHFLHTMNVINL